MEEEWIDLAAAAPRRRAQLAERRPSSWRRIAISLAAVGLAGGGYVAGAHSSDERDDERSVVRDATPVPPHDEPNGPLAPRDPTASVAVDTSAGVPVSLDLPILGSSQTDQADTLREAAELWAVFLTEDLTVAEQELLQSDEPVGFLIDPATGKYESVWPASEKPPASG